MKVIRIDPHHPSPHVLRQAVAVLRAGGVIVYPTDTAYAVGGIYRRSSVIRRVLAIKGRRDRKFTLIASSLVQARRHFSLPRAASAFARHHWPGPVSLVVSPRFAVRVPASPIARALARGAGAPLLATSANRSGGPTPYTVRSVVRQLRGLNGPDLMIDAGRLPKTKPSTIVRVDGRGQVTMLRRGSLRVSVPGKNPLLAVFKRSLEHDQVKRV